MRKDPYSAYMSKQCTVEFHDVAIEDFTPAALAPFLEDGALTKSIDLTVKGKKECIDAFIFSSTAKYESAGNAIAAAQIRIIDDAGACLYYSPVYEIGHKREFYKREWRIPPTLDRYDTVRLSLLIPEGVKLYFRDLRIRHNYGYRERDIGIRYHGHGGARSALGFQMTAELGFTSCITIPKFTKDNIPVCLHDDATVITELRHDDGTVPAAGGKYDKPVSELTYEELCELCVWRKKSDIFAGMRVPTMEEYFRICSSTGMQPIFSVHPPLTREQWITVRGLLEKYRLLDRFWVKSGSPKTQKIVNEVFGNEIAGRILIYGLNTTAKPKELCEACEIDPTKQSVVIEYFDHRATDEMIRDAKDAGFAVSIACMLGGISGIRMQDLIDLGVTEFTVDHHCSMGLCW